MRIGFARHGPEPAADAPDDAASDLFAAIGAFLHDHGLGPTRYIIASRTPR